MSFRRKVEARYYGVKADGVTDDAAALNACIASLYPNGSRSGVVELPQGTINIKSPVHMDSGVRMRGQGNGGSSHYGTRILADPTFSGSAMVTNVADGDGAMHWAGLENLRLDGNNVAALTGFDTGLVGETFVCRDLSVFNCPDSGIKLTNSQATCTLENVSLNQCGYGLNVGGTAGAGFVVNVRGLSGDGNASLLRIKGGTSLAVTVLGFKCEDGNDVTKSNPPILLEDMQGVLTVIGGWVDSHAGRAAGHALVKITNPASSTVRARVHLIGVGQHDLYTLVIDDQQASATLSRSELDFQSGIVDWNGSIHQGGQGTINMSASTALRLKAAGSTWRTVLTGRVVSKTTTYTAAAGDLVLADATSAAFTVTLPSGVSGATVTVKKTDATANVVTIAPASGTIDGAASFPLTQQYESVDLVSDGTNWFLV